MTKGAMFVGWGAIIPGREAQAKAALQGAMNYCGRLLAEERIDGFEPFLLEPHGGDLEGFMIIRGDKDGLVALRGEEEFMATIVGVQLVHTRVGVVTAYTGEEMGKVLRIWDDQEASLLS